MTRNRKALSGYLDEAEPDQDVHVKLVLPERGDEHRERCESSDDSGEEPGRDQQSPGELCQRQTPGKEHGRGKAEPSNAGEAASGIAPDELVDLAPAVSEGEGKAGEPQNQQGDVSSEY